MHSRTITLSLFTQSLSHSHTFTVTRPSTGSWVRSHCHTVPVYTVTAVTLSLCTLLHCRTATVHFHRVHCRTVAQSHCQSVSPSVCEAVRNSVCIKSTQSHPHLRSVVVSAHESDDALSQSRTITDASSVTQCVRSVFTQCVRSVCICVNAHSETVVIDTDNPQHYDCGTVRDCCVLQCVAQCECDCLLSLCVYTQWHSDRELHRGDGRRRV